jgi:hypothetical protein
LQAAWIFALPPFRGSDEFDHAYRADAVAQGQWVAPPEQAANGRGALLSVRPSIVGSASAMCDSYNYTGRDNCFAVNELPDGRVRVASAASGNHPAFYWMIGTVGRLGQGEVALTLMRITTALTSTLLAGAAAWMLARFARSRWPLMGVALALTPVLVYSTAVAAPNGVEMAAGLAVWAGLLSLRRTDLQPRDERVLLVVTIAAAIVLCTPRQLGPLWLLLSVASVGVLTGYRHWWSLLRRHSAISLGGTTMVVCAALANVAWVVSAGTLSNQEMSQNLLELPENRDVSIIGVSLEQLPLWLFQSIAAFPLRDESAPVVVYAAYLVAGIIVLAAAAIGSSTRGRLTLVAVTIASAAAPFAITLATVAQTGTIWQGRYTLPFSAGVLVLAGVLLDDRTVTWRWTGPLMLCAGLAAGVSHVVSVVAVFVRETHNPVAMASATWPLVPTAGIVILASLGVVVSAIGVKASAASSRTSTSKIPERVN